MGKIFYHKGHEGFFEVRMGGCKMQGERCKADGGSEERCLGAGERGSMGARELGSWGTGEGR
jgi:hypothetical protein